MPRRSPPYVCPRCRGSLAEEEDGYRCGPCEAFYPVVAGIPDFRVFPDPWIGIEEDRAKARRLEAILSDDGPDGDALEEAVRAYWSITPSTTRDDAERFVDHVLRARPRSEEWLELLDAADARRDPADRATRGRDGPAEGPWLDLGCGTADLAAAAASRGRRAMGVDIALRWLVVARRRPGVAEDAVRLVCACAEALPFPDGAFDRVLSAGLLSHVRDPVPVASEARRVLATGGVAAFRTVNRYTILPEPHVGVWGVGWLPRRWADAYVRWRSGKRYLHHRPLSPRELRRALTSAGFEETSVEAAPALQAETARLEGSAGRLTALYESARTTVGLRAILRWVAPLAEARGRRP